MTLGARPTPGCSMAAARRYRAYGLVLDSTLTLAGLPTAGSRPPDVIIRAGAESTFARARRRARRPLPEVRHYRFGDGTTYLRWPDLFEFLVSPDGRRIRYRRGPHIPPETLAAYLVGQVLSFVLIARGTEALHATAVAHEGKVVAFLGECGKGKSTLAAAFLARGHPLVTDDLLVLARRGGTWIVRPGIPRVKLVTDTLAVLPTGLSPVAPLIPGTAKWIVPLHEGLAVTRPLPLAACYVLVPLVDQPPGSLRPRVEDLSPRDACLAFLRSVFNLIVRDRGRLARQFAFAARLAVTVPVRRLEYPRNLARLSEVCDEISANLTKTPGTQALTTAGRSAAGASRPARGAGR